MNKDNTFKEIAKDNPKDLIEVIVGDDKEPDVVLPQAKIQRWDNETNFSLRLKDFDNYSVIEDKGKIIFGDEKKELHLYDLPKGQGMEDGGFEIEAVLYEKPDTNKIDFTIQTKGLNFYFQPPLTPEEIEQGVFRPENVEGSYAVYHATKGGMNNAAGMEYKVGKAFHIYRPKIKDANGQEVWGELNVDVDKGELTVTVPQEFLDNALYPVIVDPTFGYTSIGASNIGDQHAVRTTKGTSAEIGVVNSISVYHNYSSVAIKTRAALFDVTTLTNQGESIEIFPGGGLQWGTMSFSSPPSITAQDYYPSVWFNSTNGIYYDDGSSGDGGELADATYASPPDAFPSASFSNLSRLHSIYATYIYPIVLPLDTYYWRVRAKDEWGVWGAWSSTRSLEINAGGGATLRRYTLTTLGTG